jgi:hypothetical protein
LLGEAPTIMPHWWLAEPLTMPLPPIRFAVNADAPLIDNYWTNSLSPLYSARLIRLFHEAGVRYETFPVQLVDERTEAPLAAEYALFHLLERVPAVNEERTLARRQGIFYYLELNDAARANPRPLFRLSPYIEHVLIHETMRRKLAAAGVTGCDYTPVEQFKFLP